MPKYQSFYALSASGRQMARKVRYCNYRDNLGNLLECTGLIPPPIPPTEPVSNEYDYIIVGAGASGSILAARLGEDKNIKVLLLEHGHDNSSTSPIISDFNKSLMSTPAFYPNLYHRYNNDASIDRLVATPTLSDFSTILQPIDDPKLTSRYYAYPRGNGAGGSTNHHAMVDGRGTPYIYDSIAKLVDDDIWSYESILPYYKKLESYNVPFSDNPRIHGYDGWCPIRRTGPIEQDLRDEIVNELYNILKIPYRTDSAEPEQVVGVSIAEEQVSKDGTRAYSYNNLLQPMLSSHSNITVKFNSLVEKVIIQNNKAVGVQVYNKAYLAEYNTTGNKVVNGNAILPNKDLPTPTQYYAKKEVILCAGAISTPQILMLSGIGPKEQLEKLNIQVIKDSPGVGQNLMDHIESTITFNLDPNKILWKWQATYMKKYTDYKNLASPKIIENIEKYADPEGLTTNAVALMWDWYALSDDPNTNPDSTDIINPDSHTHIINGFFFDFNLDFTGFPRGDTYDVEQHANDNIMPVDIEKSYLFNNQTNPANPVVLLSFLTECLIPTATGSITLNTTDPRVSPIIDLGLYKDENAVNTNATALYKIRNFVNSSTLTDYKITDPYYPYPDFEIYPGSAYSNIDDLKTYIKEWQSYGHHMAGTAKMGKDDDDSAVLDSRLRVKGISGLRVVDLSIYPATQSPGLSFLHGYNPSRGAHVIGEVASVFIINENK